MDNDFSPKINLTFWKDKKAKPAYGGSPDQNILYFGLGNGTK